MKISDFLTPADVILDLRVQQKHQLIGQLADHVASRLGLARDEIASELLNREKLGSTGLGSGIAIPHSRIEGVTRPFGVMARLQRPIEFDAIDEAPVDLVFLLLLPKSENADSLAALALVSRKLRSPSEVLRMRQAHNTTELYRAIIEN
jgi:nitrogen PTS system EIIA component